MSTDKNNNNEHKKKEHADFQDAYRKSSNFNRPVEDDENLNVAGNGDVKLSNGNNDLSETDKEKIADAMDAFQERTEMTPGGEQTDGRDTDKNKRDTKK